MLALVMLTDHDKFDRILGLNFNCFYLILWAFDFIELVSSSGHSAKREVG